MIYFVIFCDVLYFCVRDVHLPRIHEEVAVEAAVRGAQRCSAVAQPRHQTWALRTWHARRRRWRDAWHPPGMISSRKMLNVDSKKVKESKNNGRTLGETLGSRIKPQERNKGWSFAKLDRLGDNKLGNDRPEQPNSIGFGGLCVVVWARGRIQLFLWPVGEGALM